jgi:alpha-L-fucosidase
MNVAPDPTGVWPASALRTLEELADWFAINGEAIHETRTVWPYQRNSLFTTARCSGF